MAHGGYYGKIPTLKDCELLLLHAFSCAFVYRAGGFRVLRTAHPQGRRWRRDWRGFASSHVAATLPLLPSGNAPFAGFRGRAQAQSSIRLPDTSAAIGYNTGAMRIRFNKSVGSNATQQVDGPKDSCSNYIASTAVRAKYSPIRTQAW